MAGTSAAAAVGTAGVSTIVVMVIAVKIASQLQSAGDKRFHYLPDIAIGSADDPDTGISESIYRTAADAAADQQIDSFQSQQGGKCAVAGVSGRQLFFADDFPVGDFKDGKSRGMPEVLKDLTVGTGYGDFHFQDLLFSEIEVNKRRIFDKTEHRRNQQDDGQQGIVPGRTELFLQFSGRGEAPYHCGTDDQQSEIEAAEFAVDAPVCRMEHRRNHLSGVSHIRRPERYPCEHYEEKCQDDRQYSWHTFAEEFAPYPVDHQRRSVEHSPENEKPACPVLQTADEKGYQQIQAVAEF
jgi:hypothetical protein